MATQTKLPKALTTLLTKALNQATFNSSGTEFYYNQRLGAKQLELTKQYLSQYQTVEINGVMWQVKCSFHWSSQQPTYFYGTTLS